MNRESSEAKVPESSDSRSEPPSGSYSGRCGTTWRRYWLLVCIILIGSATRWYHLGHKALWSDELFTSWVVEQPISQWKAVLPNDIPPGHLIPIRVLSRTPRSDFDLRLPSAISGTLSFIALYLLVRRLGNHRSAVLATGLLVFSTAHLMYSQEARMYAHLFLIACASLYCLLRALYERNRTVLWWTIYCLLITAGLFDTYTTAFVLPAHLVFVVARVVTGDRAAVNRPSRWIPVIYWIIAGFTAVVALSFWAEPFTSLIKSQTFTGNPDELSSPGWDPFRRVISFTAFSPSTWRFDWIVAMIGLWAVLRRDKVLGVFGASWLVSPFLLLFSLQTGRAFHPRYFISILPLFIWLYAEGIDKVWRLYGRSSDCRVSGVSGKLNLCQGITLLFVVLLLSVSCWGAVESTVRYYRLERMDWSGAMQYIENRAEKGDLIIPGIYYAGKGVDRYLSDDFKKTVQISPELYDPNRMEQVIRQYPKGVWFVSGAWTGIPEYVRQGILLKQMKEVETFPAQNSHGEIHILYRASKR